METFNEYLRGKQFILFTDHKPLEKLGHLHTKTLNRLQTALLEHDFIVQYKTLKAVATATVAMVLLTPAKNLKKVFLGFLVVSPLFNHYQGYV